MDNTWKLLGRRIKARIDAGLTKAELCRKAGISASQLDSYLPADPGQKQERILRAPGLDTAERIADALGEPLWKLLMDAGGTLSDIAALNAPAAPSISPARRQLLDLVNGMDEAELSRLGDTIQTLVKSDRAFHRKNDRKKVDQG